MTDETGGKPLLCDALPFDANSQEKPTLASLISTGYGGALAKLMEADATHTTIPTADLTELIAAATECARLLQERVDVDYRFHNIVPAEKLMHKINSTPVRRLRAAVERVRGE